MASYSCMDTYTNEIGMQLIVYGCHKAGGNQFIEFTKSGMLITSNENLCVGVSEKNSNMFTPVSTVLTPVLMECSESDQSQRWRYSAEVRMTKILPVIVNKFSNEQRLFLFKTI